jgi:hypothetical protein
MVLQWLKILKYKIMKKLSPIEFYHKFRKIVLGIKEEQEPVEMSNSTPESLFQKEESFEQIWVSENVRHNFGHNKILSDNDYIDYYIWVDANWEKLAAKHLKNTKIIRGDNPNLIFHGGCLGCISQRQHGVERCKGCSYFKFDHRKPNLKIEGEECSKITSQEELESLLGMDMCKICGETDSKNKEFCGICRQEGL